MLARFSILAVLCLACAKDFYFYADVRWDEVEKNKAEPDKIPFDHGLRIVPGLYAALTKLKGNMKLWTGSLQFNDCTDSGYGCNWITNSYYWSRYYSESYAYRCQSIDGTSIVDNETSLECLHKANYDIGSCGAILKSPEPQDTSAVDGFKCQNVGADLQMSFQSAVGSLNLDLANDGDTINLVLPDGTGLPKDDKDAFQALYENITARPTLTDLNKRIGLIKEMLGDDFSGIVGSSDQAYYTAIISSNLGVPNIVASATDSKYIVSIL